MKHFSVYNYGQHCSGLKQIYIFIKMRSIFRVEIKIFIKKLMENLFGGFGWRQEIPLLQGFGTESFKVREGHDAVFLRIFVFQISSSEMQMNFHVCHWMNAALLAFSKTLDNNLKF